jgi:hypothetical protein
VLSLVAPSSLCSVTQVAPSHPSGILPTLLSQVAIPPNLSSANAQSQPQSLSQPTCDSLCISLHLLHQLDFQTRRYPRLHPSACQQTPTAEVAHHDQPYLSLLRPWRDRAQHPCVISPTGIWREASLAWHSCFIACNQLLPLPPDQTSAFDLSKTPHIINCRRFRGHPSGNEYAPARAYFGRPARCRCLSSSAQWPLY